jgi:hypothetical protein
MEELRGLMHPVRRVPVELLRAIFEDAIEIAESRIDMAMNLSHVCRSWRDTALDDPRLWHKVTLTPFAASDAFWAEIIPRIKSTPASVYIGGIKEDHFPLFRKWQLSTIPNVEKLGLGLSSVPIAQSLCEALFDPPYVSLKELTIVQEEEEGVPLFYSIQLGHFPSLLKLIIEGKGDVSFHLASSPTITTLILDGAYAIDMAAVLNFPQLETLKLRSVVFDEPHNHVLTSSLLRVLEVAESRLFDESWADALKFPGLHSLYHDSTPTDLFVAFVVSHPSIKELDCTMVGGQLTVYAAAIPTINSLYLPRPFDEFLNWREAGMSHPPFPSLKIVVLADDTTSAEFEEVACSRWLPSNHPRSRLEPPTLPVDELRIILNPESEGWMNTPWAGHELAQLASIEMIPYILDENLYCAVLRWKS